MTLALILDLLMCENNVNSTYIHIYKMYSELSMRHILVEYTLFLPKNNSVNKSSE